MYIRCAFNESQVAFAGNAGISSNRLSEIERNKRPASRINTNKIIEASMLESDGKAAQLLRLKSNKMAIMTTSQLKKASVAEICEYIRILKGQTRKEVADETFLSKSQIGRLFGGDATLSTHEQMITGLWLKLPEESALATVISQKMHNPRGEIDDALLEKVTQDKYLFTDTSIKIAPINLSTAQNRLDSQVQRASSIGQALRVLRKNLGLTQEAFAASIKDRNYTSNLVSRIERGEHIPHDYTIVFLLGYLGYDIHHPITKTLLKKQVALAA
ncbi:MAG TPA: helix-turn-helix transcriptional regulator [Candidatus Acidoferrales bacterium]|nr:helix-turn-helix transcriptional regulator [Candidatus Acidoferrales bacterium]